MEGEMLKCFIGNGNYTLNEYKIKILKICINFSILTNSSSLSFVYPKTNTISSGLGFLKNANIPLISLPWQRPAQVLLFAVWKVSYITHNVALIVIIYQSDL